MRLAEYLGTRTGQTPFEYVRYQLRQMYHFTPSELAEQKGPFLIEMLQDLKCARWENKSKAMRDKLR